MSEVIKEHIEIKPDTEGLRMLVNVWDRKTIAFITVINEAILYVRDSDNTYQLHIHNDNGQRAISRGYYVDEERAKSILSAIDDMKLSQYQGVKGVNEGEEQTKLWCMDESGQPLLLWNTPDIINTITVLLNEVKSLDKIIVTDYAKNWKRLTSSLDEENISRCHDLIVEQLGEGLYRARGFVYDEENKLEFDWITLSPEATGKLLGIPFGMLHSDYSVVKPVSVLGMKPPVRHCTVEYEDDRCDQKRPELEMILKLRDILISEINKEK